VVKDIKTDTENIKEDIAEIKSESLKKKQVVWFVPNCWER